MKDIIVLEAPRREKAGRGRFLFTDRYSVFDWGEMPDRIDGKGASLCITSAFFFEKLHEIGIETHYLGVVEDGKVKELSELKKPQACMEIKLLRVLKPAVVSASGAGGASVAGGAGEAGEVGEVGEAGEASREFAREELARENAGEASLRYDYSIYKSERGNFLIPLEVIWRNALPEGSSVFRRLREGSLSVSDLGLDEIPPPGFVFKEPFLEVSTKLEAKDRYLSWSSAREIAGLSDAEVEEIKRITLKINECVRKAASRAGLTVEDGKVEFGFDEHRRLLVVDAVGTPDECRFSYEGMPVSKEVLRAFYRRTAWFEEVEAAKKRDALNWRDFVKSEPPALPTTLKNLTSSLYKAFCNEITGRIWFEDVPSLREIMEKLREFLS